MKRRSVTKTKRVAALQLGQRYLHEYSLKECLKKRQRIYHQMVELDAEIARLQKLLGWPNYQ